MAEENNGKRSVGAAVGSAVGVTVLAAACAAGGWVACELWPKAPAGAGAQLPGQEAPTVAVRAAEERAYNRPERFVAHAEAVQEVDLLPQVDGYIKEIKFKEGDMVKAGQLLYVLDDERYRAVVNQRKADLEAAEAEARRTERYWERMQKADARGITQLERDNAEAGAEKSKAAVMQAKANLVVAEYDLKKAKVIAPISGQIGKTTAHIGDYVAPSKGALARIVQIDPIRVSFPLTDRAYISWRAAQAKGAQDGRRLRLQLPDGSLYEGEGTWDFDDNQMSKDTATIIMRLSFRNAERLLVPNSYVTLLSDFLTPPKLVCVPQQALIDLPGGQRGLYVLADGNVVEQRAVETREAYEGWIPVTNVKAGERVIIAGLNRIRPGMKVRLAEATSNDDIDPNYKPPVAE